MKTIDTEEIKSELEKFGSLIGMGTILEKLGYKVDFVTEPLCLLKIIDRDSTFCLINKRHVTNPDFVVGKVAGGFM